MLQFTDPITRSLVAVLALLVFGFFIGNWLNRRRSKAIGVWLEPGIRTLGGQVSWKWLRTMASGAQITITNASKPFHSAEISYFLLTREFPPLWGIELLNGKRDLLAIRAVLRETPAHDIEVVPAGGRLQQALEAAGEGHPITWQEGPAGGPAGLRIGSRGGGMAQPAIKRLKPFLEKYGASIQRLSLRQRQPHVVLFLSMKDLTSASCEEVLRGLRRAVGD